MNYTKENIEEEKEEVDIRVREAMMITKEVMIGIEKSKSLRQMITERTQEVRETTLKRLIRRKT
jgi:hypothetical protein